MESIREIKITVEIDTNKKTVEKSFFVNDEWPPSDGNDEIGDAMDDAEAFLRVTCKQINRGE